MTFEQQIGECIQNHNVLEILYDNDTQTRIIEPHTLGLSRKNNIVLSAYQTAGYSKTNKPVAWKLFNVQFIRVAKIINKQFDIRWQEGFNPNPSRKIFKSILKQIV